MGVWKWSGAGAATVFLTIAGLTLGTRATPSPDPVQPPPPAVVAAASAPRYLGAGSCSAQACHGGATPSPLPGGNALRNEHSTWITRDEHANAYADLLNARSQSIAEKLGGPDRAKFIPAHQDDRCLACHVAPIASSAIPDALTFHQDGVSCESCHGPSGDWIHEHTRYDWRDQHPDYKRSRGMTDMRDLADRAGSCVGCHVGAPGDPSRGILPRDVNHDLIAAGHPRLNFEFGAYHANMPKHWQEQARSGDFEARAWVLGQAETLKASLVLLETRARAASANPKGTPWPEYTEYGCFSCHFDLQPKARDRDPEQALGVPTWSSWYAPMARDLAEASGESGPVLDALKNLRVEMSIVNPDAAKVADRAHAAAEAVEVWKQSLLGADLSAKRLGSFVDSFRLDPQALETQGVHSWDHATQRYLALVALKQAMAEQGSDPQLNASLQEWLGQLQFPKGYDSPKR